MPPYPAQFTVRGRWPGGWPLTYRVDENGPVPLEPAVHSAAETWNATGCVTLTPAAPGAEADVTVSFVRGAHGDCPAFGPDPGVAHAGPCAPGTFIHLDADRAWGPELSLRQAVLHELGHILGLDHSPDENAVMFVEPSPTRDALGFSDLAGIHSLYGQAEPHTGDLTVWDENGILIALSAVAPEDLTDWTLFDTDGDGDEEVLVWRTDASGNGAMTVFHFEAGLVSDIVADVPGAGVPILARTSGPFYGLLAPGLTPSFVRTDDGTRLLILTPREGVPRARAFGDGGLPTLYTGSLPEAPPPHRDESARSGDLDGDGTPERVTRR